MVLTLKRASSLGMASSCSHHHQELAQSQEVAQSHHLTTPPPASRQPPAAKHPHYPSPLPAALEACPSPTLRPLQTLRARRWGRRAAPPRLPPPRPPPPPPRRRRCGWRPRCRGRESPRRCRPPAKRNTATLRSPPNPQERRQLLSSAPVCVPVCAFVAKRPGARQRMPRHPGLQPPHLHVHAACARLAGVRQGRAADGLGQPRHVPYARTQAARDEIRGGGACGLGTRLSGRLGCSRLGRLGRMGSRGGRRARVGKPRAHAHLPPPWPALS